MSIRFDGRVAIVTGAAAGLGRSHALALASRGAKVLVNDFGGDVHGTGGSSEPAEKVATEIRTGGGEAISHGADVPNPEQVAHMVVGRDAGVGTHRHPHQQCRHPARASFGKSALRTSAPSERAPARFGVCSQAVWPHMRAANFGRILMTTSTSGIYGNFGQANYGAAKTGLIGLMNVLQIEGAKHDIRVNALCPSASTRMTQGLLPEAALALWRPKTSRRPRCSRERRCAAAHDPERLAGGYSRVVIQETRGSSCRRRAHARDDCGRGSARLRT